MTDNELLEQVFRPLRQMTVADNGFCDKVMERIPNDSMRRLSRLWTMFCVTVAAVLFVLLDGWVLVARGLVVLLKTQTTQHGLLMLAVSVGVIWLLAFYELISRERCQLI